MQEDAILIEKIKSGDEDAMEAIVKKYKHKVYCLAYDLTDNRADAEDLAQETFLKAYSQISKFRGESSFGTWLHRIAYNRYLDIYRKKANSIIKRSEMIDETSGSHLTADKRNPSDEYRDNQISRHITSALNNISPKEKSVFVLRHYNDFQLKEIALIMSISEGTVKSLLFRAVRKLQKELSFYAAEDKV